MRMSQPKQGSPTDIADRLKAVATDPTYIGLWSTRLSAICNEAADEIEALRFRLAIMHDELEAMGYERKERS